MIHRQYIEVMDQRGGPTQARLWRATSMPPTECDSRSLRAPRSELKGNPNDWSTSAKGRFSSADEVRQAQCACRHDPTKRHGPYFEWTRKAKGKTVNVKLTPAVMPMFLAAAEQYRKLKSLLNRFERLSQTVLGHQAKVAQSADRD